MSLCRIALRIAAVEAIKGNTLVGDRVLDSPNGALDVQADGSLRTDEEKPFVSVFTDQAKAEDVSGRGLVENGLCDLVIEIGMSGAMTEQEQETDETVLVGISVPSTDRTIEFFLDVIQRQVFDALSDPDNAWAEIYRGLHYRLAKIEYLSARTSDDGSKIAGRQVRLTVDLADDPVRGEVMDADAPLLQFLDKLEEMTDPTYQTQAALMRSLLTGENEEWKSLQRRHGLTLAEMRALELGDDPDIGPLAEVDFDIDGRPIVTVE
ncbi:hypothetical protein [Devosia sp. SD17-2]|uniref:hypothetical protein n=1 Tax=Devosia sp. SD17-2 TaxID=2976459 RepID=UPI0023D8184F|nr:hypothetical protein [Devosia sp. SD17-2]WEJ33867.1 hypothetical protein NYQ88_03370 [Devosia sp. SD17-2]